MDHKKHIAEVPSNIAFLKYWGKLDPKEQWPTNNSLSMTLKSCTTKTSSNIEEDLRDFEIFFKGEKLHESSFSLKIKKYLNFLKEKYGFKSYLKVETSNNFPTASGVASSASGFGALTLSALAAWTGSENFEKLELKGFSLGEVAYLARLGSGSSCRSLFGGYVLWEKGNSPEEQKVRSLFPASYWQLSDTVVILSKEKKLLGSTEAHKRVLTSPFFKVRISQIEEKQKAFEEALLQKNISRLGELLESEALEIHSLIMTASEPFSYLKDETLEFLSWLRGLRKRTALKAYFTIDAGSNVHVITEEKDTEEFLFFLKKEKPGTPFIKDSVGSGPLLTCEET